MDQKTLVSIIEPTKNLVHPLLLFQVFNGLQHYASESCYLVYTPIPMCNLVQQLCIMIYLHVWISAYLHIIGVKNE